MKAVIAINKKGVIGHKGKLPWRCKGDLKHFKKLTEGCSCIVGRKTAEKLPKLKNRALYIASSENSIQSIMKFKPDWVIGGFID
jgi:dihydrofolate reductase